jgi:hypothetical protein
MLWNEIWHNLNVLQIETMMQIRYDYKIHVKFKCNANWNNDVNQISSWNMHIKLYELKGFWENNL